MSAAVQILRRIDRIQQARWFKVAATVVVMGTILVLAGLLFAYEPPMHPQGGIDASAVSIPLFLVSKTNVIVTTLVAITFWAAVIWLGLTLTYVLCAVGGAAVSLALFGLGLPGAAVAASGMVTLAFTFALLMRAVLLALRYPARVLAVAHTVVKESVRLRVSVFFIVLLLVSLPLIPLFVEGDQALRYRIQSFISWSTGMTFFFAACMTIFLACGTVAFEIRDKQIWQLMTKPLSRFNYLIGKWLGIVSVNFVLLLVAGVSIFLFVQYLRFQREDNWADRVAVETEVLAARIGANPTYERIERDTLNELVTRVIENDFQLDQAIKTGVKSEPVERQRIARELQDEYQRRQRTVDPGSWKDFRFDGLERARRLGADLKFRFQAHYGAEDTHENHPVTFIVRKNNVVYQDPTGRFRNPISEDFVPTMTETITIPADAVSDAGEFDGSLVVSIINGRINLETGGITPSSEDARPINFDYEDLEVLVTVGGFEANYFRAMLVMWVKLAFLAMLGICAATILNFPVACLMTFTVFLAAAIGPFLSESLAQFHVREAWRVDQWVIKGIASAMVFLFEPFGEFKPTQLLVEGRLIPWWEVIKAFALLGVVWTGISLGLGFLFFRDRELATYSGHG